MRRFAVFALLLTICLPYTARSDDYRPDPRTVQRWGPAYRYPQAGWIVLHIEGEPYERGVQHGRLLAPEIAAHVRCYASVHGSKVPAEGWNHARNLTNALFLRRYDKEYLEEMKGIADGASAAGARFDGRPIDLLDVATLNAWPEIETLPSALDATPTGLEALRLTPEAPQPKPSPKPMHCSAFAATGPATADGKVVFGHITMFGLYPSSFYNVWIDVKPTRGHRVLMQSYPAGIQSGLDYYFNDAGLLVSETTIAQTRFDAAGLSLASRIRQALQYSETIDQAVEFLKKANNGLYTNEWLLADVKTNEIAMFELGTHKTRLWRSGKKEWYGGTPGFYWGCNNTKDLDVRLETVASVEGRPEAAVFCPCDRDRKWLELYDKYKGKMDADFGKLAFTTPPLAAFPSVDAKFTTTDMARRLESWALFGPPLGRTWKPDFEYRQRHPEVQPLVSNPWTVLRAAAPSQEKDARPVAVDLHKPEDGKVPADHVKDVKVPPTRPAWHGTLLPQTDADVWLATAFADYERIVALEKALTERAKPGQLPQAEKDYLSVELFRHRCNYELGARAHPEVPLGDTQAQLRQEDWYRVASGKGVLLLHELRRRLGSERFVNLMDAFGREHAGQRVSAAAFCTAAQKAAGGKLNGFFDEWLHKTGLPAATPDAEHDAFATPDTGPFSILTLFEEVEKVLIVYGTQDEVATNREAARALHQAMLERGGNVSVPVKKDTEVRDEDLKDRHVVLIGRPDTNAVVARWRDAWPVRFGPRSFVVRGEGFAHANSAVIAAAENPLNRRFSAVAVAGLGAASTLRTTPLLADGNRRPAEVVVFPNAAAVRSFVTDGKDRKERAARAGNAAGARR
jgi:hypothetical protein